MSTEEEIIEMNEEIEEEMQTNVTFTIQTALFQKLFSTIIRSANKNSNKDSERGVYLFIDHDTLTLRANNNHYGAEIIVKQQEVQINKRRRGNNFEINEGEPGGALIVENKIANIFQNLPRTTTKITIRNGRIIIKSGPAEYTLGALDYREFPVFPSLNENLDQIHIHPEQIQEAYKQVKYAIDDKKKSNPILLGVLHEIQTEDQPVLNLVATDSNQLSKRTIELDQESNITEDIRIVIPLRTIQEVLKQSSKTLTIYFSETQAIFEFDDITLYSRTLEGTYPDYNRVIPTEFMTHVKYKAEHLQGLTSRALILSEGPNKSRIKIKPELKQTRIISQEDEHREFIEDIVCEDGNGEDIELGVNLRYLDSLLKYIDSSDFIHVHIMGEKRPILIRAESQQQEDLNIILPIVITKETDEVIIENFQAPIQIEADFHEDEIANPEEE